MQTQSEELMAEEYILDPSLVLYLPLYMLDGTAIMSRDAYGHSCTVTGAIWTPQGYSFDGDDQITVPATSALDFTTGNFTFIFWINPTNFAANRFIYSRGVWDADGFDTFIYDETGLPALRIHIPGGGTNNCISGLALTAGVFQMHTIVRSGTQIIFYKNTTQSISDTSAIDATTANRTAYIGSKNGASNFIGSIGEVLIYNRALTPAEIQRNYQATKWRYS